MPLLPKKIGDLTVEYISLDDASDSTNSVTAFKKLISEQNVDALIGPSGSPNAMGVIQFAAEAGVPMLAPVGTAAVVLPMNEQKKWVFKTTQNDDIIARALVDHMAKTGIKTIGFIGLNDPYGETGTGVLGAGRREGHQDHRQRTLPALRQLGHRPGAEDPGSQARRGAGGRPGAASVLPQTTLFDQGYKGKFYQTHGAALPDFLKLGGKKVEGTILAASLMLVLPEMPDSNPSKKVAADYIAAYEKLNGSKPATFGANVYDAGLLLEKAIPQAEKAGKPGTRSSATLRDALEQTKELVGTQGV